MEPPLQSRFRCNTRQRLSHTGRLWNAAAKPAGTGLALRHLLVTAVMASLAVSWAPAAAALATTVSIGERIFEAVPPPGGVVTGVYHPEVQRQFATALPQGARLVEVYLPKEDFNILHAGGVPALDRVYQLQVLTATENKLLSYEGFAEVADALAKGFAKTPDAVRFVGERAREPWALFYALRLADGSPKGETEVGAGLVVVNYQLMQLMIYVDATRPHARDEADSGVRAWGEALRAANPDQQFLAERAGKLDLGGGASVDKAAFGIGRIAGLGAFVFILYRILRPRAR